MTRAESIFTFRRFFDVMSGAVKFKFAGRTSRDGLSHRASSFGFSDPYSWTSISSGTMASSDSELGTGYWILCECFATRRCDDLPRVAEVLPFFPLARTVGAKEINVQIMRSAAAHSLG